MSRLRPAPALAHLLAGRDAQVASSDLHTGEAAAALEDAGCLVRAAADEVVLLPVRAAVPSPTGPASRGEIEEVAVRAGARVRQVDGLAQAGDAVAALAAPGDVVLTMGVGEVAGLGALLLSPADRPLTFV
ncbi:hypothetical protein [Streptomyces avermitilis]|uniref:hypothetical protein n=1 Tax=Streptomyces avermitilis TaxID=33903 RepID=UPI0037FA6229